MSADRPKVQVTRRVETLADLAQMTADVAKLATSIGMSPAAKVRVRVTFGGIIREVTVSEDMTGPDRTGTVAEAESAILAARRGDPGPETPWGTP